jgi:hypothetical protein
MISFDMELLLKLLATTITQIRNAFPRVILNRLRTRGLKSKLFSLLPFANFDSFFPDEG